MTVQTLHPNTPETDLLPMVEHVVPFDDGTAEIVMATDPSHAIELVRERHYRLDAIKAGRRNFKSQYCSGTDRCCCGGHEQ